MADYELKVRLLPCAHTATEWASSTYKDKILKSGEIGYEKNTGRYKMGDGTNKWANLPWAKATPYGDFIPLNTSGGIGSIRGDGKYWYCLIATIKISSSYINYPITFEISGRGFLTSIVQVMFQTINNTDPGLDSFTTNGYNKFYIVKSDTSTWKIYGMYTEIWGNLVLHRITGSGANIGVTVNLENADALPTGATQASYYGNVSYATNAGSATQANKLTVNAGSSTNPIYFNGGVPTACSGRTVPGIKSASGVTTLGWGTNNNYVADISFLSYWNGAYSGTASNLSYCKQGAFGTIVTKNSGDYLAVGGTAVAAKKADKWTTARKITLTGSVTGSVSIDGSGDVSLATTTNHTHGLLHSSFAKQIANTTTDSGWSMINDTYSGYILMSLRTQANAPAWIQNNYAAGIAFGGADTKGVLSMAYDSPKVTFAGGNGKKPVWYFTLTGTSATTYNLDTFAKKDGSNASGKWGISISGSSASCTGNAATSTTCTGNAASATKATQDADGNTISTTYFRHRSIASANAENTLWTQIGSKSYHNALPDGLTGTYNYGQVLTFAGSSARFEIYASHYSSNSYHLYFRTGWNNDKQPWRYFIDSKNIGSQSVNYATSAGNASTASLLKTSNSNTTASASVWRGNITDGVVVWGENFSNKTDIGNGDTGDITLWLQKSGSAATLNMSIDGTYYAGGHNPVYHTGNKPSKSDVGLGNVDNTADANKSVKYATSASSATTASNANVLNQNTRMDYGWNGVNYFNISGTAGNAAKANDTPTTAWWHILRFNHSNSNGFYTDLAIPFNANSLYYKRIANGAVQNGGWVKVLDALNYNDYAPKKDGTGATGKWGISITGSSASCTGNAATATTAAGLSATIANNKLPSRLQEVHTSAPASLDVTTCGWFYAGSGGPFESYHSSNKDYMVMSQGYSSQWASQIATDFRTNHLAVRNKNAGTWSSWAMMLDSGNYNLYALPLAGGTMNAGASIIMPEKPGSLGTAHIKFFDNSNYGLRMDAEAIQIWSGAADISDATSFSEIFSGYIYTSGYLQAGTSLTTGTTATIGTTLTVKSNAYFKAATNYFYNGSYYTAINRPSASANYTLYLPSATGQLVYHTNDTAIGGTAKPVYIAASGAATACSSTVGSANRPVYMNAGTITALSSVSTAYGGTGVTSHTANRLVWSSSATAIKAANHYANSTKVAINYASAPTENFYVNGTSKFTNTVNLNAENNVCINFRPGSASYHTTISHQTTGNEALVFATKNTVTSFMFVNGEDSVTNHAGDRWRSITPALQIKKNCVYIGSLIADGTDPAYKFYVNGNMSVSGGIVRNGVSTSWIQGRANALIRTNTLNGYSPTMTVKTNDGSWDIGAYDHESYANELVFSFCKDTDFSSSNNAVTQQCRLRVGYGGYFVMTGNFVLNGTTLAITM